jgi:hypothetical protein
MANPGRPRGLRGKATAKRKSAQIARPARPGEGMKLHNIETTLPVGRRARPAWPAIAVALTGVAGCAGPPDAARGAIELQLVGQAPSGSTYRLRHAHIIVTGADTSRVWDTEDAPDRTSLSDDVPVGDYTATLAPGWDLERLDGGSATPVEARLISTNPAAFVVTAQHRTTVPLRFHVDTEDIDLSQGYDVVVTVEESKPQLIIVSDENNFFDGGRLRVYAGDADGDAAPLRTIGGPATTLRVPQGVTVANNEIIVCDDETRAVDFFPVAASGDVVPTRQITGDALDDSGCLDVAVVGDELYVLGFDALHVFPLGASGEVSPRRSVTDISSARFLSVDRDALYISSSDGDVVSYALPLAAGATPVRTLTSQCPGGVAAGEGELVVGDLCDHLINTYAATADGEAAPLRVLAGSRTRIDGPFQMQRFRGDLYVADVFAQQVLIFPDTATGNVVPARTLRGPHTGLAFPHGVVVR